MTSVLQKRTLEQTEQTDNKVRVQQATDGTALSQPRKAVPKFVASRYNFRTKNPCFNIIKDKDGNDTVQIQNENGYGYQILAPPGICKYIHLAKGGNFGLFDWCSKEKDATLGMRYTSGGIPQAEDAQAAFLEHLQSVEKEGFEKLFHTVPLLKEKAMKKAKLVAKDKSPEEIEKLALKLHLKGAKSPLKLQKDGTYEFQVKCGAFIERDGKFLPRTINFYDQKYQPMNIPDNINSGSIIGPILTTRLYVTPGGATYGITYQLLDRHLIFYKNGSGMASTLSDAIMDKWDRPFCFKTVTNKNGKTNIYINDLNGNRYQMRGPKMKTKYVDLHEGTLGKFPGVTESTAKLTASFIETSEESTKFFDHIDSLSQEAAKYMFNDEQILPKQKEELKATAESLSEETGADVKDTLMSLFLDTIQHPLRSKDDGRELRVSQRAYDYDGNKNEFKFVDGDCDPLKEIDLDKGCVIQPVLEPQIYLLANGTGGLKLSVVLEQPIRVDSAGSTMDEGEAPPAYEF